MTDTADRLILELAKRGQPFEEMTIRDLRTLINEVLVMDACEQNGHTLKRKDGMLSCVLCNTTID